MKIMHYFAYIFIICMYAINASENQIIPTNINPSFSIDEDHIMAAQHALTVFHTFERSKTESIFDESDFNFKKSIVNNGLFNLYRLVRCAIPEDVTAGWQFEPLFSKTGYKYIMAGYKIADLEKESLIGMIGYNPEKLLITISFRGTQCLADWCNNMTFSSSQLPYVDEGILLHGGYASIFNHTKKALKRKLFAITYSLTTEELANLRIVLTGHSLGGAVACVTIPYIKKLLPESCIKLITFGAPRVGGQNYNDWLIKNNIETTSFARKTDPAPYANVSLGYCPLGNVVRLHHFYHPPFMWPLPHDMRYYLRAMVDMYNKYKNAAEHIDYYNFFYIELPFGYKI